jgi:ankyrin repeat protein
MEVIVELLKQGSSVNSLTSIKRTPLHLATIKNNLKIVKYLLKHKSDLNAIDADKNTCMHLAA